MATKKKETTSKWEGKKMPALGVLDEKGAKRSLKEFEGKYLLIYFYPKDMTPGCTTQAQTLRDNIKKLNKLNCEVLGVSPDDMEKHQKFIAKHKLNFSLLADTEKKLIEKMGLWVEKSMYGRKYMGVQRDSFLVGPNGKIIKHYIKVKPAQHAEEVIEALKADAK